MANSARATGTSVNMEPAKLSSVAVPIARANRLLEMLVGTSAKDRLAQLKSLGAASEDSFLSKAWSVFLEGPITQFDKLFLTIDTDNPDTAADTLRTTRAGTDSVVLDGVPFRQKDKESKKRIRKEARASGSSPALLDLYEHVERDVLGAAQRMSHIYEVLVSYHFDGSPLLHVVDVLESLVVTVCNAKQLSPSAGYRTKMEPRMWFAAAVTDKDRKIVSLGELLGNLEPDSEAPARISFCGTAAAPGKTTDQHDRDLKDAVRALHSEELARVIGADEVQFIKEAVKDLISFSLRHEPYNGIHDLSAQKDNGVGTCAEFKTFLGWV
ncbi:hypothetical protein CALCODRAFT_483277 [Calocera cornea HHB12733]|uniref:Uncharacterized protein n=1 Tax=Calocera cornea HHB12733 TaxID=1353952 RepID=A0A165FXN8_9BASI|nr:hypothetical protein CALCODRAFT_483277 [Calocera cornea HHB12733]